MTKPIDFVPAAGRDFLTPIYDAGIRLLTNERRWRAALLAQVAPRPGETILDVGCGTGSFAILAKKAAPRSRVIGLDPDPRILARAAAKATAAGVDIEWWQGFARDAADLGVAVDKTVSSLVFHQVPLAEKRAGIAAMVAVTLPRGEVHIADFARQNDRMMRLAFSAVGLLDGRANTEPNARGALADILAGFDPDASRPTQQFPSACGQISLFRLEKRRSA